MKQFILVGALSAFTFLPLAASAQTDTAKPELSLPLRNGDAWAFDFDLENDIATHRLTGFVCPFTIPGDYDLISINQAGRHGAPAQCTYANQTNGGFVSLSVNWIYQQQTAEAMASRTLAISEGSKSQPTEDPKSYPIEANFEGLAVSDCHRIFLPFQANGVAKTEWIETCQMGKWTFQVNQTAPLTDQSFEEIASWTRTAQGSMASNLDNCIAPTTASATEISVDTPDGNDLLVGVLNSEVVSRAVIGSTHALRNASEDTCMIAYMETDQASLLIMRDKSQDTSPLAIYPATLKGIAPSPTIWVAETSALQAEEGAPKTYAMFGQVQPGVHHVHKLYKGAPPNDEQFIQDAQLLFSGQLPSRAYLEEAEPGKWRWNIPATTGK